MSDQSDAEIAAAALSDRSLDEALKNPQKPEDKAALEAEKNKRK